MSECGEGEEDIIVCTKKEGERRGNICRERLIWLRVEGRREEIGYVCEWKRDSEAEIGESYLGRGLGV